MNQGISGQRVALDVADDLLSSFLQRNFCGDL
jgi:hypothetical protein